jgi:hypothetical protein
MLVMSHVYYKVWDLVNSEDHVFYIHPEGVFVYDIERTTLKKK